MGIEKHTFIWRNALAAVALIFLSAAATLALMSSTEMRYIRNGGESQEPIDTLLSNVMAQDTLRVLMRDRQVRRSYLALIDMTADLSRSVAERYQVPELEEASKSLDSYRQSLDVKQPGMSETTLAKRLFGIGEDKKNDTESAAEGFLDSLLQPLTDALSGIGNAVAGDLTAPAMFLGVGVGEGAAQGLKLASAGTTKQVADRVIQENGMESKGFNPVIQNLGMGASASLLGAVNFSSLVGGGNINLQDIALSLAEGIGNGTASGLKLSPAAEGLEPSKNTDIPNVVGTFGFGLTKTVVSNIDLSKASSGLNISSLTGDTPLSLIALSLAEGIGNGTSTGLKLTKDPLSPPTGSSAADTLGAFGFGLTNSITRNIDISALSSGSSFDITKFVPSLGAAALSLGQGLGNGTVMGLHLTSRNVAPDTNGNDVPSAVGNFAFGLSKSVTENVNISALTATSSFSTMNASDLVSKYLPDAASGLGKGLGEGILIGLGLQPDFEVPTRIISDGSIDAGGVAENFAKGFTSRLLANGSASKLINSLGSSSSDDSGLSFTGAGLVNIGKVTQGVAMGLVQGAGDAIEAMGGVQALINGTAVDPVNGLPNTTLTFDDSVNGAATGFGQGLGGQGTLVGVKLLSKLDLGSLIGGPSSKVRRSVSSAKSQIRTLDERQVAIFNGSSGFNLSVIINANTISSALQGGIDALTCEGVGGLVLVATGLMNSGVLSPNKASGGNANSFLKQAVPPGLIQVSNAGNTFQLDSQKVVSSAGGSLVAAADGLNINGNTALRFAIFLVIHSKNTRLFRFDLHTNVC